MWKNLFGSLSKDLGIDFGTANTRVYVKERGIVVNEPSVVAINSRSDQIIAVGNTAKKMVGKTPPHIEASNPLIDGVVSDFEVAEKMLKYFIDGIHKESFSVVPRPRVVISIPLDVTEVERKAVEDAVLQAGAREVHLLEEPLAAAVGARIPIQDSNGNMMVNIGAGTTAIAVLSLNGIVAQRSLRMAGDELNKNIISYIRDHFNVLLGETTAEDAKKLIGVAHESEEIIEAKVRGRDLVSGLPREIIVNSNHVHAAMARTLEIFIDNIKSTLERTPPELVADIYERGIMLSGGTALLRGLSTRISDAIKIPVHIVEDPLTAVVRGTGITLEDIEASKELFLPPSTDLIG